jgi:hypothetical protein
MADNQKPGFWQQVKRGVAQGLLWVAVKLCEVIIFVVDTVTTIAAAVKETAQAAVEVGIEVANKVNQRVHESPVFQTIAEGYKTAKRVWDAKEFPSKVKNVFTLLWVFVTGQVCTTPSWAASSGWCTFYSVGYVTLIAASGIFALYLIGLLSAVFRS